MPRAKPRLKTVVAALHDLYGDIGMPVTEPFAMILLENVAYLVTDSQRYETFARLREEIGLSPKAILSRTAEQIAQVIAGGGMKPLMRAEKVREAARIASEVGLENLSTKRVLRRFPSIGEPYADRILLFSGAQITVAPDSNALRVLGRLGFCREEKNYAAMYRSAVTAASDELSDAAAAQRAHLLLRRHGQEVCTRSNPKCDVCPLRRSCAWYARVSRRSAPAE